MLVNKDINRICKDFVSEFGAQLAQIAAAKQLAMSTIAASSGCDLTQTVMTNTVLSAIDKRAVAAGFTVERLNQAVNAIRLAGEVLHHLTLISQPIAEPLSRPCAAILDRVMHPGGLKVE